MGTGLTVEAEFLRKGDLVGLIWESEDGTRIRPCARDQPRLFALHVELPLEVERARSRSMRSTGLTLTIEGRKEAGVQSASGIVRLWNYASGQPTSADDKPGLRRARRRASACLLTRTGSIRQHRPDVHQPCPARDTERAARTCCGAATQRSGDDQRRSAATGREACIAINDAWSRRSMASTHRTAYDDMYNLPPRAGRRAVERLGYRGTISHYIGMSHYLGAAAGRTDRCSAEALTARRARGIGTSHVPPGSMVSS